MTIEEKIFVRAVADFGKLAGYGFVHSASGLVYEKEFMHGDFKAVVVVDDAGKVSGEVYETDSDDIYFPLRVESMETGFVGEVRSAYERILLDIRAHCFNMNCFVYSQANRLTREIFVRYGDSPEFPWDKFNRHGVFRDPDSRKWYALILSIDRSRLDKKLSGGVEVVNIKADADKIPELLKLDGFYPAYHMNKKSWISIVLDGTVSDEVLLALVAESHAFAAAKKSKHKK